MDANESSDLQRMYLLLSRVSALDHMKAALQSYIKATGQGIVMDEEKDPEMVQALLDLKARVDEQWEASFGHNEGFANAIKDAFETLVNMRQVRGGVGCSVGCVYV